VVPLLPLTVIVRVPVAALLAALTFMVEVPPPVIDAGLKLMVTPVPDTEAVKAIAELKPPVTVEVIVDVPELPFLRVSEAGESLSEKPGGMAATVREIVLFLWWCRRRRRP
jgi:hypothetical protein